MIYAYKFVEFDFYEFLGDWRNENNIPVDDIVCSISFTGCIVSCF